MKVLMFGWEFPPFNQGGLGTACYGLTKSLVKKGVSVTFVLPKAPKGMSRKSHVELLVANDVKLKDVEVKVVDSLISGYMSASQYREAYNRYKSLVMDGNGGDSVVYGENLFDEVLRYARQASLISSYSDDYDLIHAHDWMTYQAGINAKKILGVPLVVHVHATEFDRTGGNPNQYIYDIERMGMHEADSIICVSNYTKNMVINHYGVDPSKVHVVHNGVEFTDFNDEVKIKDSDKIVLFLGRVTIQKGPDWFLYAAKKVLEYDPDVKFVVAGSGDMMPFMVEKVAEMGMHKNFLFAGFLRGKDIDRAYKMASVYVMPSISEPFGITPLEAMRNGTPVIISRQSGVSEVVENALKVDFWDVDEMANKIIGVLKYSPLKQELSKNSVEEVKKFSWDEPAEKCINVYSKTLENFS